MTRSASEVVPGTLVVTVKRTWLYANKEMRSLSGISILPTNTLCMTIASVAGPKGTWHRCYIVSGDTFWWVRNIDLVPYDGQQRDG